MTQQNYSEDIVSEPETLNSYDSQDDPTFDIIQETQSKFSNLSIKKKSRSRFPVEASAAADDDDDINSTEIAAPVFNATDEKSFELVQKIVEVGMLEKLKVEQCKLYLRKHGLRLTGKKDILIHRIKEHISIMKGEGEHKYPPSSFVMNCKGDACTGDVVMFEQNVYEIYSHIVVSPDTYKWSLQIVNAKRSKKYTAFRFNIASRSGGGPPSGKRIVAGRIVKESYGAAKQQHTFTIEVLWSKGEKPLPPLHPLLIKGRNLYRLTTMRQRWEDEGQRKKNLSEKHDRGNAARNNREVRLHEKETRMAFRENRASKGRNIKNEKQEQKMNTSPVCPMINSRKPEKPPTNHRPMVSMIHNHHGVSSKENIHPGIVRGPVDGSFRKSYQVEQNMGFNPSRMFERREYDGRENMYHPRNPTQNYGFRYEGSRQQLCRYYPQGRCHYGTNCKYLH